MSEEIVTPDVDVVEASKFGWVPQEEFKGNPDDWRDAGEFLKRGREINGYLRKDLEKIKGKNSELENQLLEVKSTLNEFKEFHAKTEERAYKRALEELKQAKKQAIVEGDGEKVVAIDEELDALKESKPTVVEVSKGPNPQDQQIFNSWHTENEWFGKNRAATAFANDVSNEIRSRFPTLVGRDFLEKVTEAVKEELPNLFENPNKGRAAVDTSGSNRPVAGKKGYSSLPPEAKQACDKFVKSGLMTKEQYVDEYFTE